MITFRQSSLQLVTTKHKLHGFFVQMAQIIPSNQVKHMIKEFRPLLKLISSSLLLIYELLHWKYPRQSKHLFNTLLFISAILLILPFNSFIYLLGLFILFLNSPFGAAITSLYKLYLHETAII